jgi:hypothetical protein
MNLLPFLRVSAVALALLGVAPAAVAQDAKPVAKPDARPEISYTVRPGDTLSGLARIYLVDGEKQESHQRLAALNDIKDPNRLIPGTVLRMPLAWLRREAAGVIVLSVTGDVRSGDRPLKAGDPVPEGAQVISGANGYASLEFADRSVITLKPGTTLRIESHKRNPKLSEFETRLRLGAGEVEAAVTRQRAPNFRIYAPTGNIAVRGTQYRVRGGDDVNQFEILEGKLEVAGASGGSVPVGGGFGTVVRKGEQPIPPVKLLEKPDVSGIPSLIQATTVRLRVPVLEGATSYLFRAATDREFRDMVVETTQRRPEVRIVDLREAEYFYGVRGVDANGLQGQEAVGRFQLQRPPMPEPQPEPAQPAPPQEPQPSTTPDK